MFRFFKRTLLLLAVVFILPGLLHLAVWASGDRPRSWHQADWSSSGILPAPELNDAAAYVLTARTGGLKGALATHSWIVLKKPGRMEYDRYDVVGWGKPVRKNAYPADGRWYSNDPRVHYKISGIDARARIGKIEAAIAAYRWRKRGDYILWPGPNSNTFVASILNAVPGFDTAMPATAVGRDFPVDGKWLSTTKNGAWRATLAGYAGIVIGRNEGLEINFLGLVVGINPANWEVKIPAFGAFHL